jgi:uncharacterized protein (TIGR00369 family)
MQNQDEARPRRSGYRTLIGYRTKAWREGYGEVELEIGPQHLNSAGIVHGGIYCALLDVAMGHAVGFCTVPGNFRFSATVALSTNFLKAAQGGVLVAVGRIDGIEGRLASASGEVRDASGALCAVGQASLLYRPGSERPEGVPRR